MDVQPEMAELILVNKSSEIISGNASLINKEECKRLSSYLKEYVEQQLGDMKEILVNTN